MFPVQLTQSKKNNNSYFFFFYSDEDHGKKTDAQSANENIYKNGNDGKISQETSEITSFNSEDDIQMFDGISWDNEDLAIDSVNENSGADYPKLLSMDFLDDID